MQPFDFFEFLSDLRMLFASLLLGVGSCLSSGCSESQRTREIIDIANQSGAAYNITLGGQPGIKFSLGNQFGVDFGTTVTANLSGNFRAPSSGGPSPALVEQILSRLEALEAKIVPPSP